MSGQRFRCLAGKSAITSDELRTTVYFKAKLSASSCSSRKRKERRTKAQSYSFSVGTKEVIPNDSLATDAESTRKKIRLMDIAEGAKRDCSFILSYNWVDWNDKSEGVRRFRAKVVASHARDNCELRRSEFAWDADAWRDVFGNLRDDGLIAM